MSSGITLPEREVLRVSLAEHGWARAAEAAPVAVCDALLADAAAADWTGQAGEGFALDTAPLHAPDLLQSLGGTDLRLIRHGEGQFGLPLADLGPTGFILDLGPDWRSEYGGLLMFEAGDRLRGWRPGKGTLTLFDPSRPVLLSLGTAAPPAPRLSVLGRLT